MRATSSRTDELIDLLQQTIVQLHPNLTELTKACSDGNVTIQQLRVLTILEQQELFGRLMFGIALTIVGDITRSRRQLGRLIYLLHVVDTPSAYQFALAIRQAAEEQVISIGQ